MKQEKILGFFTFILFTFLFILNPSPVYALNKEFVGETALTDIHAYINGKEIESYHWNGKVYIPIQELKDYGFAVSHRGNDFEIYFDKPLEALHSYDPIEEPFGQVQGRTYAVYDAGRKALFTTSPNAAADTYVIADYDCIPLSELSHFGYIIWNPEKRFAYGAVGQEEADNKSIVVSELAIGEFEKLLNKDEKGHDFIIENFGTWPSEIPAYYVNDNYLKLLNLNQAIMKDFVISDQRVNVFYDKITGKTYFGVNTGIYKKPVLREKPENTNYFFGPDVTVIGSLFELHRDETAASPSL